MPNFITLPNGKRVSLGTYTRAWRALLKARPNAIVPGWEWYDVTAAEVLYAMRCGLQDRINTRGNLTIRESRTHPAPLLQAQDGRSRIEPSAWKTFSPAARKALAHRADQVAGRPAFTKERPGLVAEIFEPLTKTGLVTKMPDGSYRGNYSTEITPEGEQTVIPGCERQTTPKNPQGELF